MSKEYAVLMHTEYFDLGSASEFCLWAGTIFKVLDKVLVEDEDQLVLQPAEDDNMESPLTLPEYIFEIVSKDEAERVAQEWALEDYADRFCGDADPYGEF